MKVSRAKLMSEAEATGFRPEVLEKVIAPSWPVPLCASINVRRASRSV